MARKKVAERAEEGSVSVQFSLVGLIIFSLALVLAGGALVLGGTVLARSRNSAGAEAYRQGFDSSNSASERMLTSKDAPPWGDLLVHDISVERPEEYIGYESRSNGPALWVFDRMTPDSARSLMISCGVAEAQVNRALSPTMMTTTPSNTTVQVDEELVFSLTPPVRAKLYQALGSSPENHYMQFPFNVPNQDVDGWFAGSKVDDSVIAKIRKLIYPRGPGLSFSDFELVMNAMPSDQERMILVKTLSRQAGLLVRVQVRPDTDLDRLLGYWSKGLQAKDTRPLLESVRRLPGGGTVSIMYLLSHFARERLYTFPVPPKPGDPAMDCHWSTMNFFNDPPDNRFANPAYTVRYLQDNYYAVSRANQYGDVVLVLNQRGDAIHSAIYLAEDIVFTKNGNNYAQPWMLVRLKDLEADYSCEPGVHLAVYRNKKF
jgi:hypothetical protein